MNGRFKKLFKLFNNALYIVSAAMLIAGAFLTVATQPVAATTAGSGSIWTTKGDCGSDTQDVNQYYVGDYVYINYKNFAVGSYTWAIKDPGTNGTVLVGSSVVNGIYGGYTVSVPDTGEHCFLAYRFVSGDARSNPYSAVFGDVKKDNLKVDASPPSPTNTSVPPTPTNTSVPPTPTDTSVPPTATDTSVPPTPTDTSVPPTPTDTSVPPTPTDTGVPPTPTDTLVPPTPTIPGGQTPFSPTDTPEKPKKLDPPVLGLAPDCNSNGELVWTVYNPNNVGFPYSYYTVDGGAHKGGGSIAPGKHILTTTGLGTHTIALYWGDGEHTSLTDGKDVCPLIIPVTGGETLIPVTGADKTGALANFFLYGSLAFAGFGFILTSLRRLFKM